MIYSSRLDGYRIPPFPLVEGDVVFHSYKGSQRRFGLALESVSLRTANDIAIGKLPTSGFSVPLWPTCFGVPPIPFHT